MAFESFFGSMKDNAAKVKTGSNPAAPLPGPYSGPTGSATNSYLPIEQVRAGRDPAAPLPYPFQGPTGSAANQVLNVTGSGASPQQGIMDFLTAFNAPTLAGFQQQQGNLLGLQAAQQANYGAQKNFMGQGNVLDKALLGIQQKGIGIQQGDINTQYGFLDQRGGFLDQLRALAGQGFENQQSQINEKAEQQHRATKNDFVGRGATVAPEHGLQHEDIDQEQAQAIEAARLGYEKEKVGLDEQGLSLTEQRHRLDIAGQMLGLDLEKLGINGKQLDLQLKMGLANLGLDQMMSTNDLWDRIQNSFGEESQFWMTLFQQAAQMGMIGDSLSQFGW